MASWRLTAQGPTDLTGAALLPVPAKDAGAWSSRGVVAGSPGTTAIPAPAPAPGHDRSTVALANAGNIGLPSSDFDHWLPSVYYVAAPQDPLPVSRESDNQMPVPARDPIRHQAVVMPGPVMLGQYQVATPHVAPKYLQRR